MRTCKICGAQKPDSDFRSRQDSRYRSGFRYEPYCMVCEKEYNKQRCKKRYEDRGRKEFSKMYSNKEKRKEWLEKNKKWREENPGHIKKYRTGRRKKDIENFRVWQNNKRKTDVAFKLRALVSTSVYTSIKRENSSKTGSIKKHLPYTIEELKKHLELQFESWMSWDNHGRYISSTWNDDDSSTWTWQIDHIIPHSNLPYDSMKHPNFLKCWGLKNLRPLSAKQNLIDGIKRLRHKAA